MDTKPSSKEIFLYYNTMASLVKGLEQNYTIIDFRDESSVTGKIVNVDGFMNIEMEDCYYYNARGIEYPFDSFFVKARNIRFVHIPQGKNAVETIQNQLSILNRPRRPSSKKLTFKEKRAKNYQKELLMNISKQ